ncbi:MAG: HD domain-containing protein [Candidatus Peregrinibacteria bacterium]|nr:HD domain-containing protein [Candidatus Peregrinibacteria bacterium]
MNREEAQQLLNKFHTPKHVQAHCKQVAKVGEFLALKMKEKGIKVDPEKVWIAGLIHDIMRVVDFKTLESDLGTKEDQKTWKKLRKEHHGKHHADVGAETLEREGEIELANIVRQHKYTAIDSQNPPSTWEAKLLYYADKRVSHDKILPLMERLEEGRKRHYPNQAITTEEEARRKTVQALEVEIFKHLDLRPEDLKQAIE